MGHATFSPRIDPRIFRKGTIMFTKLIISTVLAAAAFTSASLPVQTTPETVASPTCCAKNAYCCTTRQPCCPKKAEVAEAPKAAPTCCSKNAYCCTTREACCPKK